MPSARSSKDSERRQKVRISTERPVTLQRKLVVVLVALVAMIVPASASAAPPAGEPGEPELLATLEGGAGSGSSVGPGGALYVPQPAAGEIWRIDPESGEKLLYASGLPQRFSQLPFGGVMDVAFIGSTAYALVSVVGSQFPDDLFACNPGTIGIYRVDGPTSSTVVADIGMWACDNPPDGFPFVVPTGVQYALETYRGGFLVTDGHHNRVLRVTLDGTITDLIHFGDVVPTGLAVSGNTIYLAEAGPVPHEPQTGRIVSFEPGSSSATEIASGARLAVDVEMGRGRTLFALSQGTFPCGGDPACAGAPAEHDSGALMRANGNGGFTTIADALDQPTSLEIIGNSAYVVTLGGEVWKVDDVAGPPYGA
jgi:hypothetical protein